MLKTILILCTLMVAVYGDYEEEYEHHEPNPYHFGYEVKDKHGVQFRKEESDGHGQVHGSYGYTDEKGIYREVHYVADKGGFRAEVKTNEPGTSEADPASIKMSASPKHEEEYHGYENEHDYEDNDYRRIDNNQRFARRHGDHGGHE